jgi:hypothetical protein
LVRIDVKATVLTALIGGPSVTAALIFAAPAMADPVPVVPMPPVPAPADPAVDALPSPQDAAVQAASADPAAPPEAVPHLPSLENLPPGTTDTPVDPNQSGGLAYLRDLWHAVQTQEVSGKDALLLLTQRPMNADAVPPPGMPANPTPPLPPGPPLLPEPAPAP